MIAVKKGFDPLPAKIVSKAFVLPQLYRTSAGKLEQLQLEAFRVKIKEERGLSYILTRNNQSEPTAKVFRSNQALDELH